MVKARKKTTHKKATKHKAKTANAASTWTKTVAAAKSPAKKKYTYTKKVYAAKPRSVKAAHHASVHQNKPVTQHLESVKYLSDSGPKNPEASGIL